MLAAAMPGCEKLELVDGVFHGDLQVKVGPISGKFSGKVQLADQDPPHRYRMIVDGKGPHGFVKANATIELAAEGDGTRMRYDADAQVGGKIATVGQRLVETSAKAITKASLEGLHENINIRAAAHRAAAALAPPALAPPALERAVAPAAVAAPAAREPAP
ncbi:MAG TPA: carbon monoxide dehydrogenase subunit G, partial [Kofleriaceae bacterium]|nr:carbon monoxide dehydrogenase subunit G [Kofleriaceae bacterium]